jgi:hypothetical protein
MDNWLLIEGDCATELRCLTPDSFDALITDPPAGIAFMGKQWDSDGGDPLQWSHALATRLREALRVLKPGAHGLVWALPRTAHWTGLALHLAGFEIRDVIVHLFGTGFPKSLDVSKAIDKAAGADRTVVGRSARHVSKSTAGLAGTRTFAASPDMGKWTTAPATPDAKHWHGWGTALKPGAEHWFLVRKPLSGTTARNLLSHGTGAINIDACRIPTDWNEPDRPESWKQRSGFTKKPDAEKIAAPPGRGIVCHASGRWPANVVFSHPPECGDQCIEWCPVRMLDEQAGERVTGTLAAGLYGRREPGSVYQPAQARWYDARPATRGGASRFFYCVKPSTREREIGCDALPLRTAAECVDREPDTAGMQSPGAGAGRASSRRNNHPCVKSITLMRWLIQLVTPPGGTILDPFCGSGSTGCAAMLEKCSFVGIEQDPTYVAIAKARIRACAS